MTVHPRIPSRNARRWFDRSPQRPEARDPRRRHLTEGCADHEVDFHDRQAKAASDEPRLGERAEEEHHQDEQEAVEGLQRPRRPAEPRDPDSGRPDAGRGQPDRRGGQQAPAPAYEPQGDPRPGVHDDRGGGGARHTDARERADPMHERDARDEVDGHRGDRHDEEGTRRVGDHQHVLEHRVRGRGHDQPDQESGVVGEREREALGVAADAEEGGSGEVQPEPDHREDAAEAEPRREHLPTRSGRRLLGEEDERGGQRREPDREAGERDRAGEPHGGELGLPERSDHREVRDPEQDLAQVERAGRERSTEQGADAGRRRGTDGGR